MDWVGLGWADWVEMDWVGVSWVGSSESESQGESESESGSDDCASNVMCRHSLARSTRYIQSFWCACCKHGLAQALTLQSLPCAGADTTKPCFCKSGGLCVPGPASWSALTPSLSDLLASRRSARPHRRSPRPAISSPLRDLLASSAISSPSDVLAPRLEMPTSS